MIETKFPDTLTKPNTNIKPVLYTLFVPVYGHYMNKIVAVASLTCAYMWAVHVHARTHRLSLTSRFGNVVPHVQRVSCPYHCSVIIYTYYSKSMTIQKLLMHINFMSLTCFDHTRSSTRASPCHAIINDLSNSIYDKFCTIIH